MDAAVTYGLNPLDIIELNHFDFHFLMALTNSERSKNLKAYNKFIKSGKKENPLPGQLTGALLAIKASRHNG